jgi:hypothetical protein
MDNLPAMVTSALFIAVVLFDLMKRRKDLAKGHFFLGVVSVLLMAYLHEEGHDMIAWVLLSVPFILIAIGLLFSGSNGSSPAPPRPYAPGYSPAVYPGPDPDNGAGSSCPVPNQVIPAKKQCAACSKGRPMGC